MSVGESIIIRAWGVCGGNHMEQSFFCCQVCWGLVCRAQTTGTKWIVWISNWDMAHQSHSAAQSADLFPFFVFCSSDISRSYRIFPVCWSMSVICSAVSQATDSAFACVLLSLLQFLADKTMQDSAIGTSLLPPALVSALLGFSYLPSPSGMCRSWAHWCWAVQSSQNHNHRLVWVGKDLKDHPVAAPPWAGTPALAQAVQFSVCDQFSCTRCLHRSQSKHTHMCLGAACREIPGVWAAQQARQWVVCAGIKAAELENTSEFIPLISLGHTKSVPL